MITATNLAIKKIKQNLERRGRGVGITVGIKTTGCSGLAYMLEYLDSKEYTEGVTDFFTDEGVIIRVSNKDLVVLDGMQIDYVRRGLNEGFEFNNPNEKDRCGCGESFRI
jgi:iron-sulfur cluster assembly protein